MKDTPGWTQDTYVVVQDDVFNHSRIGTVVVCALSSNLHRAPEPGVVLLDAGEGGLARQSVVIASQISSLYKHRLQDHIGRLSEARVDQIVAALRFLQAEQRTDTLARVALVAAPATVIRSGLAVMGVTPVEEMR